jgi:NitT/TauT family transport system substrate-binding protein
MSEIGRRQFLRAAGITAAAIPFGGLLASCSSSSNSSSPSSTPRATTGGAAATASAAATGGTVGKIKAANGSSILDAYVNVIAGPVLYGKEFGLDFTTDDNVQFQSGSAAIQTVLGGKLQIVSTGAVTCMSAIAQGSPLKIFLPYLLVDDTVIAATDDITSIADLKSKNPVIGVDSNTAKTAMDQILVGMNAGFVVDDLKNVQTIESSGERTSALAAGQVSVAVIHQSQLDQVAATGKKVHALANMYEAPGKFIKQCWMAPAKWLDENQATATAFAASLIKGSRELKNNQQSFVDACKKVIKKPPADDELAAMWQLVHKYDFWPTDTNAMEPERIQNMIDLGVKETTLEEGVLTPDKVVDTRAADAALKMLA